jgi:hypothetical protein
LPTPDHQITLRLSPAAAERFKRLHATMQGKQRLPVQDAALYRLVLDAGLDTLEREEGIGSPA